MSIKGQTFLYLWINTSVDYDWVNQPLKDNVIDEKIMKDFLNTNPKIHASTVVSKWVILKDNKLYIYRIGKINSNLYPCLFGFCIDSEQKGLFLSNLSFFLSAFELLFEKYLQIPIELSSNSNKEVEFDLEEMVHALLEENKEIYKLRLKLDSYLIQHPNWNNLIITEEKENEYIIESNDIIKSRDIRSKKKKTTIPNSSEELKAKKKIENFINSLKNFK